MVMPATRTQPQTAVGEPPLLKAIGREPVTPVSVEMMEKEMAALDTSVKSASAWSTSECCLD